MRKPRLAIPMYTLKVMCSVAQYFIVPPLFLLESSHSGGIQRNPVESSGVQRNGTGFHRISD